MSHFDSVGRIPAHIQAKASALLNSQRPRRLHSGRGEVIEVGYLYRLIRTCDGGRFRLMTH